MKKNIQTLDAYVDGTGETGLNEIAFTSDPAILVKGVAFSSQKPKMRIAAPALIPMEIYRYSSELGEYNVRFTTEEIENIVNDFQSKQKSGVFNLEHETGVIAPAYILESWFVRNPETDASYTTWGIEGIKEGSWFVVAQITDEEYYNNLVNNGQTGFSIEGFLGLKIKQSKKEKMKKNFKFIDVKSQNGDIIFVDGDLVAGNDIFMVTPDGEKVVPEDGDITLEDGCVVSVAGGKITNVTVPETEMEPSEEEVNIEVDMKCGPKPEEMVDETPASGTTEPAPAEAPVETPAEPAPSEMPVTIQDVNNAIESKVSELVAKIAELQAKIDEMSIPVAEAPKSEVKMSVLERYHNFLNQNR